MIGQTLQHFKITAKLGEGGMGEVYRAEDSRLGREVAIKVLPETVAGDAERLARFEREAKVLASLNHPNIAGIHQVEEDDGVHFLVMELAEGEDLAKRIAARPLAVDEALAVALQVTVALEAAHEKGIVHRDLKPANVMVGTDGQVKVLDFGLAKAMEIAPGSGGPADLSISPTLSPTLTAQMTQAGIILGTAAYMSPEQARGEAVDRRSDIWAFGVLLYELLTGQKTYSGKTITDVIAAVVTKEPDWDALPSGIPAQVRRLLARCAQKEPHERLHDIADARIAIQEAIDHPEVQDEATTQTHTNWIAVAAAAVAGLLIGALLWRGLTPSPTSTMTGQASRLAIEIPTDQELVDAVISRDGRMVAYVARPQQLGESREGTTQLYLRPLDAFEARVVAGTDRVVWATFSPDGRWLAYYARDPQGGLGKIKKVAAEGGPAITLLSETRQLWGATGNWRDDGGLLTDHLGSLVMLPTDGGELETIVPAEAFQREVILGTTSVPGSADVLMSVGYQTEGSLNVRSEVVSLVTGERRLLRDSIGPIFLGDDLMFAFSLEGFFVIPFDVGRLEFSGAAVPLFPWDYAVSVSDNGTLLRYWEGFATRRPVVVDRNGETTSLPGLDLVFEDGVAVHNIRWSPEGQRLALTVRDPELRSQIFAYDLSRGALSRLSFPGHYAGRLVWSPDGESIAFSATTGEPGERLYVRSATGSDTPESLLEGSSEFSDEPFDWSPDGSTILFTRSHEQDSDVLALDFGSREVTPLAATPAREHSPTFSPDGRWVALVSDEGGSQEVYVVRFDGLGGEANLRKFRVSANGGRNPQWAPDGKVLYFLAPNRALTAIAVEETDDAKLRFGVAQELFSLPAMSLASNSWQTYDPHPDGTRFAMISIQESEGAAGNLQIVLNWFEELRQKLQRSE